MLLLGFHILDLSHHADKKRRTTCPATVVSVYYSGVFFRRFLVLLQEYEYLLHTGLVSYSYPILEN